MRHRQAKASCLWLHSQQVMEQQFTLWWVCLQGHLNHLNWTKCPILRELPAWKGSQTMEQRGKDKANPGYGGGLGVERNTQSLWSREASSDRQAGFQLQEARWCVGQEHSSCRDEKSKSLQVQRHGITRRVWWTANVLELRVWGGGRWQMRQPSQRASSGGGRILRESITLWKISGINWVCGKWLKEEEDRDMLVRWKGRKKPTLKMLTKKIAQGVL